MIRVPAILVLCMLTMPASAVETIRLSTYLDLANQQGIPVIYSNALVKSYYRITWDETSPLSIDQVREALNAYELSLAPIPGGYAVISESADDPDATDPKDNEAFVPAIEEVVVTSSIHEFMIQNIGVSTRLDQDNLTRRPLVANDPLRVGTRLPGAATNGISARPAIRGGREDETLILFDDVRLYEPFHLNSFESLFSVMDTRTIDSISIHTGGFPVTHGDRLSAVMSITPVSPGQYDNRREVGIGLYTASYLQTGDVLHGNYVVSARRSTIDLIGALASTDLGKPAFADLYASYHRELSSETGIQANLLWYGDDVSVNNSSGTEEAESSYGNTYAWLTLDHAWHDSLTSRTIFSIAGIKNDRDGYVSDPGVVIGSLSDDQEFRVYTLDHQMTAGADRQLWTFGARLSYVDAEYGFTSSLDLDPRFQQVSNFTRPTAQTIDRDVTGTQAAVYLNSRTALGDGWYLEGGLRVDGQDYLRSGWETDVSPRVSLLYRISPNSNLRLSWGEFSQAQGIHELDISDGVETFEEPQESTHQVISYEYHHDWFEFRAEAYRKTVDTPKVYFENLTEPKSLTAELQADRTRIMADEVRADGFEVNLSTEFGRHSVWMNYSRARVEEDISGIDSRRSTDQKHAANLGWAMTTANWVLAVESTYHSGWPTSALIVDESGNVRPGFRNDRRLGHFMTVDLKASRSWQFGAARALRLEAGITNLLNRANPIGNTYRFEGDALVAEESLGLPIAPILDVYFSF